MTKSKKISGNSLIEAMVILTIITLGSLGVFRVMSAGQGLSTTTEHRVQAINIAREGMEGVINIRNSNWLRLSSDYDSCWKVDNYNANCTDTTHAYDIPDGEHILVQNGSLWRLMPAPNTDSKIVWRDANGLNVQSGAVPTKLCNIKDATNCRTVFYRTIKTTSVNPNTWTIESTVNWSDQGSKNANVSLKTTLTNWKKNTDG